MASVPIPTIISPTLEVTGDLESDGEVQVEGTIRGNLRAGAVQVGRRGTVEGLVEADEVVVYGRVGGGIRAASLELTETAVAEGEIRFGRMTVAGGASIEGRIGRLGAATRAPGATQGPGAAAGPTGTVTSAPEEKPLAGSIEAPVQTAPEWDIIDSEAGGDSAGEGGPEKT